MAGLRQIIHRLFFSSIFVTASSTRHLIASLSCTGPQIGAPGDDTQGPDGGCVWLLSVEPDSGLVRWSAKVSSLAGIPLATGTEVAIGIVHRA